MDEDTHLCLRCQQLVVGLDNYVTHRSRNCLASAPPVVQSCWSEDASRPNASNGGDDEDPLNASDFFLSLELKSADPRPPGVYSIQTFRSVDKDSESDVSEEEFVQSVPQVNGRVRLERKGDLSEDDIRPPRTHTGGKWKPGSRGDHGELDINPPESHTGGKWKPRSDNEQSEYLFHSPRAIKRRRENRDVLSENEFNPLREQLCENWKTVGTQDQIEDDCDSYRTVPVERCKLGSPQVLPKASLETSNTHVCNERQHENGHDISIGRNVEVESIPRVDNSEEDISPPRTHTGGKWKPGTRPDLTNEVWVARSSSPDLAVPGENQPLYSPDPRSRRGESHCEEKVSTLVKGSRTVLKSRKMLNFHDFKENMCFQCEVSFQSEAHLGIHMFSGPHTVESVTNPDVWLNETIKFQLHFVRLLPYQCALCRYFFTNKKYLLDHFVQKSHVSMVAQTRKPIICLPCRKIYHFNKDLIQHFSEQSHCSLVKDGHPVVITKLSSREFCKFCRNKCKLLPRASFNKDHELVLGNTFANEKQTNSSFTNLSKAIRSNQISTSSRAYYLTKQRSVRSKLIKGFSSKVIRNGKTADKKLEGYISQEVGSSRLLLCDSCGKSFKSVPALLRHTKRHETRNFQCPDCECSFHSKGDQRDHSSRVHSEERPYLCDKCGYASKSRQQLRKHKLRLHSSLRRPCPHPGCNFKGALSTDLSRHMRIHAGVKPYKCPYCKYRTSCQENLRSHVLKTKKHKGKKVYPCPKCRFTTNGFNNITSHLRQIHGVC